MPSKKVMYIHKDLKTMTDNALLKLIRQIPNYLAVIAKKQIFTKIELGEFVNRIGHSDNTKKDLFYNEHNIPSLIRVTNKRDHQGRKTGLFENKELGWHCNGASRKNCNEVTLILFCENPGYVNHGITSFCDMKKAYQDLPADVKCLVKEIQVKTDFKTFSGNNPSLYYSAPGYKISPSDIEFEAFAGIKKISRNTSVFIHSEESIYKPLVRTHPWHKKKSIYFIPSAISDWRHKNNQPFDSQKLWNFLYTHCYSEKYIYHHRWEQGDLLFNDQYYYMHKRTKTKGPRSMWRFCVNNEKMLSFNHKKI